MKKVFYLIFCFIIVFSACKQEEPAISITAKTFDESLSDPEAIRVADDLIEASGGMQAWEDIAVIKYNFFGRRWHLWDKKNQKVRIENTANDTKMILDLQSLKARVYKDGKEWTDADTIKKYSETAYKQWINDSYWLMMPFKVKDGGVRLTYLKEDTTQSGIMCDVIELKFDSVGVTPQNKYHLWVGKNSSLVAQWAYFPTSTMDTAAIINHWDGYIKFGNVFLSTDRGTNRQFSGIKIYETVPTSLFKSFEAVDWEKM